MNRKLNGCRSGKCVGIKIGSVVVSSVLVKSGCRMCVGGKSGSGKCVGGNRSSVAVTSVMAGTEV